MSDKKFKFSFKGNEPEINASVSKPLPTLEAYRILIDKDATCTCHHWKRGVDSPQQLAYLPIQKYDHDGGWNVLGYKNRQWLYVTCPKCGYEWSLWKLGVPRDAGDQ